MEAILGWIAYYLVTFLILVAVAGAGIAIGIRLRKKKNAKENPTDSKRE